jgi:hypothetical protein
VILDLRRRMFFGLGDNFSQLHALTLHLKNLPKYPRFVFSNDAIDKIRFKSPRVLTLLLFAHPCKCVEGTSRRSSSFQKVFESGDVLCNGQFEIIYPSVLGPFDDL